MVRTPWLAAMARAEVPAASWPVPADILMATGCLSVTLRGKARSGMAVQLPVASSREAMGGGTKSVVLAGVGVGLGAGGFEAVVVGVGEGASVGLGGGVDLTTGVGPFGKIRRW